MKPHMLRLGTLMLLLTVCCGCVRESQQGNAIQYQYDWWVWGSVLLAGLVAMPVGWFLRSSGRFGWGLLIGGPVAALLFAPSLFMDRATVDENSFSLRSGIWGMTAVHDIDFADIQSIRKVSKESRGRRGRRQTKYYLECQTSAGQVSIPLNNNVARAGGRRFLEMARVKGIPFQDNS